MDSTVNNNKDNKKTKRRAYESLLLLLLTISLFITATFAWFTDSAFSKGNKVMAGNLFVDVVVSEEELMERYHDQWNTYHSTTGNESKTFAEFLSASTENGGLNKNYKYYTRKYEDGSPSDTYYIITNEDEGSVNLHNVEPGQAWSLDITYANNGDLALKAAGALKIEKFTDQDGYTYNRSYTGIQTLVNQRKPDSEIVDGGFNEIYFNDYAVNIDLDGDGTLDTIDPEKVKDGVDADGNERSYNHVNNGFIYSTSEFSSIEKEYVRRFKKLYAMQGKDIDNVQEGDAITYGEYDAFMNDDSKTKEEKADFRTKYTELYTDELLSLFNDPGAIKNHPNTIQYIKDDGGHLEEVLEVYLTKDREEINKGHESEAYFGSLASFELLTTYGSTCDPNFDYDLYTKEDTTKAINALDETIPEEHYMILNESLSANLYNDYQNYLTFASGYCLPKDAIKGTGDIYPKDGVNVLAYDKDGNIINDDKYKGVSELGKTFITLYMPTDADSKYQNASISLQLGVTATQVEYEMDDTGFMIYDKFGDSNKTKIPEKGDFLEIPLKGELEGEFVYLKVLDVDDDVATTLLTKSGVSSFYDESKENSTYIIDENNIAVCYEGSDLKNYVDTFLANIISEYFGIESSMLSPLNYYQKVYSDGSTPAPAPEPEPATSSKFKLLGDKQSYKFTDAGKTKEFVCAGTLPNQITSYFRPVSLDDIYGYYDTDSLTKEQVAEYFSGLISDEEEGDESTSFWTIDSLSNGVNVITVDSNGTINFDIAISKSSEPVYKNVAVIFDVNINKLNDFEIIKNSGSEEPKDETKKLIGVSLPTDTLKRWKNDGDIIKEGLESAGYEVDLKYASLDNITQHNQVKEMIENKCDVIVITGVDSYDWKEILAEAKKANIPVIAYDRLILESDAVSYYVTFNNFSVGVKQAEYIVDNLNLNNEDANTYNIEIFAGDSGDLNAKTFYDGAMSILDQYIKSGKLIVKSSKTSFSDVSTTNWSTEIAQSRMNNLISSYYSEGTNINAVLCSSDSVALGVNYALVADYTGEWPIITGQDCDIENVKNMIEGLQSMSVFKDTSVSSLRVVEMVKEIASGSTPTINDTTTHNNGVKTVPSYLCEPFVCTVGNYKELLIDSGYYSEEYFK